MVPQHLEQIWHKVWIKILQDPHADCFSVSKKYSLCKRSVSRFCDHTYSAMVLSPGNNLLWFIIPPVYHILNFCLLSVGCTQIAPQENDMRSNNMSFVFTLVPVISAIDSPNKRMELSIVPRECGHTAGGSLGWKGDHTQTGVWQGVANCSRFHLLQKFRNPETLKILYSFKGLQGTDMYILTTASQCVSSSGFSNWYSNSPRDLDELQKLDWAASPIDSQSLQENFTNSRSFNWSHFIAQCTLL